MTRLARPLILTLAAIALAASVASLYVHYQLLRDPTYTSFCDVSETVSCEAVYQSAYGSFYGVPVAAGGAIWAGLVLLLRRRDGQAELAALLRAIAGYIFVLATIGLAAVLYFGYASFFVLNRLCLLCLAVYVAVIGIFIVSGAAAAARVQPAVAARRRPADAAPKPRGAGAGGGVARGVGIGRRVLPARGGAPWPRRAADAPPAPVEDAQR